MMIVTMTLAGDGAVDQIRGALESARTWAAVHVILDSCSDCRLEAPLSEYDESRKYGLLYREPYTWPNDFAQARNDLFRAAADAVGEFEIVPTAVWAVTLDADERIHGDIRAAIVEAERRGLACVSIASADGTYTKPRAFKLPCSARWVGKTHEAIQIPSYVAPGVTFSELPKTPEQLRAKFARDIEVLEATLADDPTNARAWYYAGDACEGLGLLQRAAHCFDMCAILSRWDEEAAWSRYRQAVVATRLDDYESAKRACALGMLVRPDYPEFPWLIGWCELEVARKQGGGQTCAKRALAWGGAAASMTQERKSAHCLPERIGFRHAPAHYEGPDDVLRNAYRTLGADELAAYHDQRWAERLRARVAP